MEENSLGLRWTECGNVGSIGVFRQFRGLRWVRVMRQPGPGCESLMSWCRGRGQRLRSVRGPGLPPHWQRPLTHTEPDMGNYHPRATRAGSSVIRSTGDQGLWGQHQSVITLNWVGLRSKHWYHCGYLVMVTWNSFALSWIVRIKITRELFGCFHLSNWLLSARQQNDLGVEWGMWAFEEGAWSDPEERDLGLLKLL